jgi:hypothetical protein
MKNVHLKTLLQDSDRCKALVASQDGIYLDYCRQSIHVDTMVCSILVFASLVLLFCFVFIQKDMLFELAGAAGLDEKRAHMASGKHINETEDRAGTLQSSFRSFLFLLFFLFF